MRKSFLLGTILLVAFSIQSNAQFTFGVSPGLNLNSAHFGYRFEKLVPFFGFQFANLNANYETSGSISGPSEVRTKATVFMPTLGLKYFAFESGNVQAYFTGSVTKPFLFGKRDENGLKNPEFEEAINNIKVWGGQLGFGAEYFFSDNFSLGGEFGFMLLNVKIEDSYNETVFNPDTGTYEDNPVEETTRIGFNPTYSKISLNYYF